MRTWERGDIMGDDLLQNLRDDVHVEDISEHYHPQFGDGYELFLELGMVHRTTRLQLRAAGYAVREIYEENGMYVATAFRKKELTEFYGVRLPHLNW